MHDAPDEAPPGDRRLSVESNDKLSTVINPLTGYPLNNPKSPPPTSNHPQIKPKIHSVSLFYLPLGVSTSPSLPLFDDTPPAGHVATFAQAFEQWLGDQRGSGLGARLYVTARDAAEARERPLLIEVDSEREACPDRDVRLRRKQFYRRLGARQVQGLAYDLPLETGHVPPALDVLIDRWSDGSVSKSALSDWLSEIYAGVYGQAADDPRIAAMLRPLPEEITIA